MLTWGTWQMRLLEEVQRAKIGGLTVEERLAVFLNLYHILLVRGLAARGRHLCDMAEDERRAFFIDTTIIVAHSQVS